MKPIQASIATGLLLGLSFPPSPIGWISLVALVPLLLAMAKHPDSFRGKKAVGYFYVSMFLYHSITNWWVMSWQEKTDPYLMASGAALWLFHPFFLMLPFLALSSIRRRLGLNIFLMTIPFAYAGFEWLHGQTDVSYPWLTLGYSLIDTPMAQLAEFVGVYGLSFGIATVSTLITVAIVKPPKRTVFGAAALILSVSWIAAGWLCGSTEHLVAFSKSQSRVNVALVQTSEDPWNKWSDPREQVRMHIAIVDSALSAHDLAASSIDLVVWPETAIPYPIFEPRFRTDAVSLAQWADSSGFALLTGVADEVIYGPGEAPPSARRSQIDSTVLYDVYNAAAMLNPGSTEPLFHRKSMLTPFAERLPFADQLTFAMSWIEWGVGISSWGKGRTRVPLPVVKGADTLASIAPIICIESIYPEVARDFVNNGADMLCVITNDAWYDGTWGPGQHFDIARMRAIEQRRFLIRCGMSGVTGIIHPSGEKVTQKGSNIDPESRGVATGEAVTRTNTTLYAEMGDVVPPAGLLMTFLLLIGARIPAVVRKMQVRS